MQFPTNTRNKYDIKSIIGIQNVNTSLLTDRFENAVKLGNFNTAGIIFVKLTENVFPRHKLRPQLL